MKDLYDEIRTAKDVIYAFSSDMIHDRALYLFDEWYNYDNLMEKSHPCGLFTSQEAVEQYIRNDESENESDNTRYRSES